MSEITKTLLPLSLAVGASLLVGSLTAVQAAENPFSTTELTAGYLQLADNKDAEGKCGEGTCGDKKDAEGKCGEGKCGIGALVDADKDGTVTKAEMDAFFTKLDADQNGVLQGDELKLHKSDKDAEGKCGEGKCGGQKS